MMNSTSAPVAASVSPLDAAPSATKPSSTTATSITCDVVIVGCGVAGLYCALNLPRTYRVIMLSKGAIDECDSMLAQGGICMLVNDSDYDAYFEDTMRAGHYENRADSVEVMIRSSRRLIADLVRLGVDFERTPAGDLAFTREGAHSRPRICYHADITGEEITTKLLAQVRKLSNVEIREHTCMTDLIMANEGTPAARCAGVRATGPSGEPLDIHARATVLATGGIGGLYKHSTNFPLLTGDGCRIAANHGAALEHMDYVQIHPTSLYTGKPGRSFLISESCRGEGAILLDRNGERFTDELQPRDVVTAAIKRQMAIDGTDHVWLSFERIDRATILEHFPHIYEACRDAGYDILHEPAPVVPAQHYFMGGIHVDLNSETTVPDLYAAGETSCNGVHGKNRLASNSLLESLVFARRAAYHIATGASLAVDGAEPQQASGAAAQNDTLEHASAASQDAAPAPINPEPALSANR